jgi:pimeloyl-ACP methyl ester carboxylesterase
MPKVRVNGAGLNYADEGAGPETIVFAHGLAWDLTLYDAQVAALRDRYRCVCFDFRGQGGSEVMAGGYDMDTLAQDAAALIEALGVAPCHFVGLSMGGFVGLRLAARRPELLRSLALLDTSAGAEPFWSSLRYRAMAYIARWLGPRLVLGGVKKALFGPRFLADPARAAERERIRARLLAADRVGLCRATLGVVSRRGVAEEVGKIRAPTLVLVGEKDVATVPDRSRWLHAHIAGSRLVVVPEAGHSPPVEEPACVNAALADFLAGVAR